MGTISLTPWESFCRYLLSSYTNKGCNTFEMQGILCLNDYHYNSLKCKLKEEMLVLIKNNKCSKFYLVILALERMALVIGRSCLIPLALDCKSSRW